MLFGVIRLSLVEYAALPHAEPVVVHGAHLQTDGLCSGGRGRAEGSRGKLNESC